MVRSPDCLSSNSCGPDMNVEMAWFRSYVPDACAAGTPVEIRVFQEAEGRDGF
jgi:hypothetical protein